MSRRLNVQVVGEPERVSSNFVHGYSALPVRIAASGGPSEDAAARRRTCEWSLAGACTDFARLIRPRPLLPYLEMTAKLLKMLGCIFDIFSKCSLKSLNIQADFNSAIRRFDPSRPSQASDDITAFGPNRTRHGFCSAFLRWRQMNWRRSPVGRFRGHALFTPLLPPKKQIRGGGPI